MPTVSAIITLSSFNLLIFTQVLTVLTSTTTVKYNEYVTDKGKNISIPCIANNSIIWVKEDINNTKIVQLGKYLVLTNVTSDDQGLYICFAALPFQANQSNFQSEIQEDLKLEFLGSQKNITIIQTRFSGLDHTDHTDHTDHNMMDITTINTIYADNIDIDNNNIDITTVDSRIKNNILTTSMFPVHESNASITTKTETHGTNIFSNNTEYYQYISKNNNYSFTNNTLIEMVSEKFQTIQKLNLMVRSTPGPVTQLYFKASTILGFLIWRFNNNDSGGYPIRSFTAEYRNISYDIKPYNKTFEYKWIRMDPINIAPNVRQMEVYHLEPNTTYEFRIWANNRLGSGEIVTTNVTTLSETKEEDLIRLLQSDLEDFDVRIWIVAVSIVLGTLTLLTIGLCIVLSKECSQSSHTVKYKPGWDSMELVPNIILNPGFSETADEAPFIRTGRTHFRSNGGASYIIDNNDYYYNSETDSESDHEPRFQKIKRKLSIFFTGPTIKRI